MRNLGSRFSSLSTHFPQIHVKHDSNLIDFVAFQLISVDFSEFQSVSVDVPQPKPKEVIDNLKPGRTTLENSVLSSQETDGL